MKFLLPGTILLLCFIGCSNFDGMFASKGKSKKPSRGLASVSSACQGEKGYFYTNYRVRNPIKGGFVSYQALVEEEGDDIFIGPEAAICGSSRVSGNVKIYGKAKIVGANISEYASIYENAVVRDAAEVGGSAKIYGDAIVSGSVVVDGKAIVAGNAQVYNESEDYFAQVTEKARITGSAIVTENALVSGNARVQGHAKILGDASISGRAMVKGCTVIKKGEITRGVHNTKGDCAKEATEKNVFPESAHPYKNNANEKKTYVLKNAKALAVTFDEKTSLESGYDFVNVNGTRYTGKSLAGKTVVVPGSKLKVLLTSDESGTAWGYKITKIKRAKIKKSFAMTFVKIPAGSYKMGSDQDEWGHSSDELPRRVSKDIFGNTTTTYWRHRASVDAFEIMTTEVTQKMWYDVMGNNPSHFKCGGKMCADKPVENVSWFDVQEFIEKLNKKTNHRHNYRLPTEEEWEYAARAGTTTVYSFGEAISQLDQYGWYKGNSGKKTHPVAKLKPNRWGLYDMHGNVYEMVQDWYQDDYSGNPGRHRVRRGGCWGDSATNLRSANRSSLGPTGSSEYTGFRLVRGQ